MSAWKEAIGVVEATGRLGPGLASLVLALVLFLIAGTIVRGWFLWRRSDLDARHRWRSVATWWILTILFLTLLVLGPRAVTVTMAILSGLLLREALRLVDGEGLLIPGLVVVAALYAWAWLDADTLFLRVLPVVIGSLLALEIVWRVVVARRVAPTRGVPDWLARFRPLAGATFLSLLGPSYVVAVAFLPPPVGRSAAGMGWFALLFVLTELNDSAQAWGGRAVGRRPMAPKLSPGKTWAGFWSGVLATTAAAVIVGPLVTSYGRAVPSAALGPGVPSPSSLVGSGWLGQPWIWSVGLGVLVALAGVAGDLLESSLKRRAGVKDSGDVLPGHGGLMDRFDSLALTAPVFFTVTWFLWF